MQNIWNLVVATARREQDVGFDAFPVANGTLSAEWRLYNCGDLASTRTSGIRAVRDFRFVDERGAVLGRALSIWLMLDAGKKRPLRLPQVVLDICNAERSDPDEFEIPGLTPPNKVDHTKLFEVGWTDLDANNHTNNVNYVEWALEALPLIIRRHQSLTQMDIEFLGEAFYGDKVTSEVELGLDINLHRLSNASGKILSLAASQWVPII